MDPITMAMVASSALKAGGSIMSGFSRSSQMKQEAANARMRANQIRLQGKQDKAQRLTEFDSAIQTIAALRGARGVGFDSPSAIAVDRALARQSREGLLVSQLGFSTEYDNLQRSARALKRGARMAVIEGFMGAAGSAFDIASMTGGGAKGK
jgi:hypothetical protein